MKDETYERVTGHSLDWWVDFLGDRKGRELEHGQLVELALHEMREGSTTVERPEWYAQSVAVHFERAIGRREVGQRCDGKFAATASKTVTGTMDDTLQAWAKFAENLVESGSLAGLTEGEPRISQSEKWRYWKVDVADGSRVAVNISTKPAGKDGAAKSSLAVNHERLASKESADEWKSVWKEALADFAQTR